jgi:hypothetical protein
MRYCPSFGRAASGKTQNDKPLRGCSLSLHT